MRSSLPLLALPLLLLGAACGNRIGDSCALSHDCSPRGDRVCDVASPGGYCTIIGCSSDSCPSEAVCVRFFTAETDIPCDPDTEGLSTFDCTTDEMCALGGFCAPRNAEIRFCMAKCNDHGDCRNDYECRDRELMMVNGGEPVPPPGERPGDNPQAFCAAAPLED